MPNPEATVRITERQRLNGRARWLRLNPGLVRVPYFAVADLAELGSFSVVSRFEFRIPPDEATSVNVQFGFR